MTLTDQKAALITRCEADMKNYDEMLASMSEKKQLCYEGHQNSIAVVEAQIEAHLAFVGVAA